MCERARRDTGPAQFPSLQLQLQPRPQQLNPKRVQLREATATATQESSRVRFSSPPPLLLLLLASRPVPYIYTIPSRISGETHYFPYRTGGILLIHALHYFPFHFFHLPSLFKPDPFTPLNERASDFHSTSFYSFFSLLFVLLFLLLLLLLSFFLSLFFSLSLSLSLSLSHLLNYPLFFSAVCLYLH